MYGKSIEECKKSLKCCLRQIQEFDLHLNRAKCLFSENKIEFLGHTVEYNKVSNL